MRDFMDIDGARSLLFAVMFLDGFDCCDRDFRSRAEFGGAGCGDVLLVWWVFSCRSGWRLGSSAAGDEAYGRMGGWILESLEYLDPPRTGTDWSVGVPYGPFRGV